MKLNSKNIAILNIKNKMGRSIALISLTAVLAFFLFISSFLVYSLSNGMKSLSDRMGADIILVPKGSDTKITSAILTGEPSSFFFSKDFIKRASKVEGVLSVTPQLYLATLSAGCCSFPVQIIGFDYDSDFIIKPWLENQIKDELQSGEVVVGNNIIGEEDAHVQFFNQSFKIKGRLGKTGMGFDNTAFLTIDEAVRLAKEHDEILMLPSIDYDEMISSIMIKVKDGYDPKDVQNNLRREFTGEDASPMLAKSMISGVGESTKNLSKYIYILIALIWILVFIVLYLVYSITIKERKREFATLRILGANKKTLRNIIFQEIIILNGAGAILGSIIALIISILFGTAFSQSFKMPFLAPSAKSLIIIFILTTLVASLMGPLSALYSIRKMDKEELALLLKEND